MGSESIIKNAKCCFFCGSQRQLEKHHCIKGTANRRLAEANNLWVWLCADCHRGRYGVHGMDGHEYDEKLKQVAEYAWLKHNNYITFSDHQSIDPKGIAEWIRIFGKNYL